MTQGSDARPALTSTGTASCTPTPEPGPDTDWEPSLRQALRALPPESDPTRLAALEARVLAHWQANHTPASGTARQGGPASTRWPRGWLRQRWMMVSGLVSGLALSAMLALGLGVQIPGLGGDPALDELMQMDVLSQMAIGEM
jgi:hypothetical protein